MSESTQDEQENTISAEILPARFGQACLIGKGGMAMVFKAFDKELKRTVAIKLLCFDGSTSEKVHERFFQEARTLSKLDHPNIVKILGTGLTKSSDPYHVLEFLEGHSLADEIKIGKLTEEMFFETMIQVGEGLAFAHRNGVLHRDLKPSNIFVLNTSEQFPRAKIVDFGIARVIDETSQDDEQNTQASDTKTLTRSNELLGSPAYMSPEQCMGLQASKQSDIYAFGCIIYECLTAHTPFEVVSTMDIMYKHIHVAPESLELRARTESGKRLGKLVDSCLQKDPDNRPASVEEIVSTLKSAEKEHLNLNEFEKVLPVKKKNGGVKVLLLIALIALTFYLAHSFQKSYQVGQIKVKKSSLTKELQQELAKTEKDLILLKSKYEKKSEPIAERAIQLTVIVQSSEYVADLQMKNGEKDKANKTLNEVIELCKQNKIKELNTTAGLLLGSIYSTIAELNFSDPEIAEKYFKKSIEIIRANSDEPESSNELLVQISIFKYYMSNKDWSKAREEFAALQRIWKKAENKLKPEDLEAGEYEIKKYLYLLTSDIGLFSQTVSVEEVELCVDLCDFEINSAHSNHAVPSLESCIIALNKMPKDKRYYRLAHHIYQLLAIGFKQENEPGLSQKYQSLAKAIEKNL